MLYSLYLSYNCLVGRGSLKSHNYPMNAEHIEGEIKIRREVVILKGNCSSLRYAEHCGIMLPALFVLIASIILLFITPPPPPPPPACVSRFVGCHHNCQLGFGLQSSHVIENHNKSKLPVYQLSLKIA